MNDREWIKQLQNSMQKEAEQEKLEETIQMCTEIMHKQLSCGREQRTGFWRYLSDVFRFEGLRIFGLQAVTLFFVCLMIGTTVTVPRYIPAFIPLFVLSVMPAIFRSQFYGMCEIEAVTRASGAQIILAKLILAGAANLVCLTVLLYVEICLQNSAGNIGQMVLYCLVPYLVCLTVMLRLIRLRGRESMRISAAAIFGACFGWTVLAKTMPKLYEASAAGIWLTAFLIFAGFFLKELSFIIESGKEGKMYGIIG